MTRCALLFFALFGILGTLGARPSRSGEPQYYMRSLMGGYRSSQTLVAVRDKQTEDPLIGATVTIISRADTLRGTTIKENYFGFSAVYKCDRVFRDSVDLEVTYVGYKPYKKRFGRTDFQGLIPVQMEIDEQSIAQVVVVGQQVAMVFRGDTTVYNAGAFKTLADDRFEELLRQLPGVEIKDNQIYSNGEQVKRVTIDGRNLFGDKTSFVLTDLEASDVKSVRVYEELSPENKRLGNVTARKEKVMDVETKSKRTVLQGGELAASLGASLERDYSGRHEIRHAESANLYRNSERGNLRADASYSKDDSQQERASFNSKITPSKQTYAQLTHMLRRGDSTSMMTIANFNRSRQSSVSRSQTEYFPTDAYTLRNQQSENESLSKSLSINAASSVSLMRRKQSISANADFSLDNRSSSGNSRTLQQIDEDKTRTDLHNDSDNRDIRLGLNLYYNNRISKRSRVSVRASGTYRSGNQEGWRLDTTASTPGLQVELRNDGNDRSYSFEVQTAYNYQLGEKGTFSASYKFNRDYNRSKQLAVDFHDDPRGLLDTINSYNYTTDTYTHEVGADVFYRSDAIWMMASLNGSLHQIARSERFPDQERFPRQFFQLNPTFGLYIDKPQRNFSLNIDSSTQMISTEDLRSTLDATNPLALRAGNPDLKLPNKLSARTRLTFRNPQKALEFGFRLSGEYTLNYIATRRTLYLEDTPLPQYDYTAQKGAQLTTKTNVGGCYNLGGGFNYSQQIASLRSTINAMVEYGFRQTPYFLGETLYRSGSHSLRFTAGFDSGFSTKVKLNLSTSTSMSSYTTQEETSQDLREQVRASVSLRFGKYFGTVGTLYEFYCNSRSHELTRHNVILNAAAGRKFGEKNRLSCSVGVVDILNRPDYASTSFQTDYIVTSSTSYLGRYGYLRVGYRF